MSETIKIAFVEDHVLLRNGLSSLATSLGFHVLFECDNGTQLIKKIETLAVPDLILMDISMPEMDGFEATLWLTTRYPEVNVLALSMYNDETSIIQMIKNGAKGYLLKDASSIEFKNAITSIMTDGFYYSENVNGRLFHKILTDNENSSCSLKLSHKEMEFLKLACSEMTYKEIAGKMHVSPRTVDGYRDDLFKKLGIKSRVGLAIYAIKKRLIKIN